MVDMEKMKRILRDDGPDFVPEDIQKAIRDQEAQEFLDIYNNATGKDFKVYPNMSDAEINKALYDDPNNIISREVAERIVNFDGEDVINDYFNEPDFGPIILSMVTESPNYDEQVHNTKKIMVGYYKHRVEQLEAELTYLRGDLAEAVYSLNQYENEHGINKDE